MMASALFALLHLPAVAQKVTINGYIRDRETKEALIGANIYDAKLQKGTTSNQYGFYSITLPVSDTLPKIVRCFL